MGRKFCARQGGSRLQATVEANSNQGEFTKMSQVCPLAFIFDEEGAMRRVRRPDSRCLFAEGRTAGADRR